MKINSQSVLLLVAALLLITNSILLWQNINLKNNLKDAVPKIARRGEVLIDFEAKNLNDVPVKIVFNDRPQKRILLYFRTDCNFCHAQMDLWREFHKEIDREKYKITAITPETDSQSIDNFVQEYGITDWEILKVQFSDAIGANLIVTPYTLVVDQNRMIEQAWSGRWSVEQTHEVNRYFSLNLSPF